MIQLPYADKRPAVVLFSYKPSSHYGHLLVYGRLWPAASSSHARRKLKLGASVSTILCCACAHNTESGSSNMYSTMVGNISKRPTLNQLVVYHVNMPAIVNASLLF